MMYNGRQERAVITRVFQIYTTDFMNSESKKSLNKIYNIRKRVGKRENA